MGHWFDAFAALRDIAETSNRRDELIKWVVDVCRMYGEFENLKEAWPEAYEEATR